ncbi:MAG: LLM class flavin-dependent oxidoreductase [Acidimicrobiia bacterium]|nr:LLM class flavin-dependent oxidoreductase [Acidimicrobiia bacterium]
MASPLRFGLVDHIELSDTASMGEVFRWHLDLVTAADEAGLWGYHTTEHHLSALDATPSPSLFLAAAAPLTSHIQLCSLVHIITGYHPVRLAEEIIMLDHLTDGRFQLGVGKGVSPPEHRLLDLVTEEVGAVFDDHLRRLVDVLEGKPVDGAPIPFSAVQDPYPPLWYAGNARRAAELNLHVIIGGPPKLVADQIAEHRRIGAERRSSPTGPPRYNPTVTALTVGATRHVLVDRDGNRARRRAVESWATYTRHINHHFDRTGESATRDPTFGGDPHAAMAACGLVAGSPTEIADSYHELVEVGGADYLLGSFHWGDLTHPEAMSSFELFVTEVMPAVAGTVG